ncbi:hypothetical protein [Nitrobacter sp.]|jgi:hypothetical protein|uniref:hypothetical protein n=1 Tax=Nitrobacter sp. TaxID=29420 RepID=UPI003F64C837
MRQMISGLVAAAALMAASAAPAMACGGLFTSAGCSPCSPCAQGYHGYYGAGYGIAAYERLPSPTQYYYVNQGPTFSGPGNFAPVPTYQEAAVSGWNAYSRPYYYPYDGGRYAHAMHHYYDGAPVTGPVVYSYRWHHAHRHGLRYGHAPHRHGHVHGPRHHPHGHHHPVAHRHH